MLKVKIGDLKEAVGMLEHEKIDAPLRKIHKDKSLSLRTLHRIDYIIEQAEAHINAYNEQRMAILNANGKLDPKEDKFKFKNKTVEADVFEQLRGLLETVVDITGDPFSLDDLEPKRIGARQSPTVYLDGADLRKIRWLISDAERASEQPTYGQPKEKTKRAKKRSRSPKTEK